jgi:hypothetical protein
MQAIQEEVAQQEEELSKSEARMYLYEQAEAQKEEMLQQQQHMQQMQHQQQMQQMMQQQ